MLLDFLIGLAIAFGLFALMYAIKSWLLSPVPRGGNMRISTVIAVHGSAPELETTVKALRWLRTSGKLDAEIVLRDCGMDGETAAVAEKLAGDGLVKLIF